MFQQNPTKFVESWKIYICELDAELVYKEINCINIVKDVTVIY